MRRLIILLVALTTLASCFQQTSYSTHYVLKPLVQTESGGDYIDLEGVQAFAFAADSAEWKPRSYEQAISGIIANDEGETQRAMASSLPYEDSRSWVSMSIDGPDVLIVAVDTENLCYGFTNYSMGENLPTTYVSVVFRSWKEDSVYKDGNWYFYPTIVESEEEEESAEEEDEATEEEDEATDEEESTDDESTDENDESTEDESTEEKEDTTEEEVTE